MTSKISPTAAFSETLHFITSVKLDELEKQRVAYKEHAHVIDIARARGESSIERVELLLGAIRSWPGYGASRGVASKLNLENLDCWLSQARVDPSVSKAQIRAWADDLEAHIRRISNSFDYAKLFGNLFTEWLSSGDEASATETPAKSDGDEPGEDFTEVGRKEAHEQRAELEARVFTERKVDVPALEAYLNELFCVQSDNGRDQHAKRVSEALEHLRRDLRRFSKSLLETRMDSSSVKTTITTLLREDLLDNQKRSTLTEFSKNDTILSEIATVLNMHIARIATWEWPKEGVVIEMRRALNGKYRFYLQEELLLALFLHYVGTLWEVHLKKALRTFIKAVGKPPSPPATRKEIERRREFLDEEGEDTIETLRANEAHGDYFLTQLVDSVDGSTSYDDDGKTQRQGATSMKQRLLDLMTTESIIARALHGSHTVLVSDFEWFGPSLPFDSILTVLKFLGVGDDWITFFRRFLAIPLCFKGDPAGTLPRVRTCGVPISHRLSSVFGESILFVMDFAVNQRTNGLILYRIFDDLQLWHHDAAKVLTGWREMQRYAALIGINFNAKKTGSVTLGGSTHLDELPSGDVRWGFLRLDADAGKFVVDNAMVEEHIVELRRQVNATRSVFGLVNALNHYVRFIVRNLGGRPANCFGAAHLDDMIRVVAHVQRSVFPKVEDGIIGHLRVLIEERFGMNNVPLGWFFLPNALGGLGLENPLIELLAIRKAIIEDPAKDLEKYKVADVDKFERWRENWLTAQDNTSNRNHKYDTWDMTFEEFAAGREKHNADWSNYYFRFLTYPEPWEINPTPIVSNIISTLDHQSVSRYLNWDSIGFYDQWVLSLYCEEIVGAFGSLAAVDPELIPVAMLELFRGAKIRWEQ